jgi:hypothetical protein
MREQRQQMEVDLRKADAQHVASTAIANEQAAATKHAAEQARRHRDPEPGTLPAVASGKPPVGMDSSAAVENILQKERVKEDLASMFTP